MRDGGLGLPRGRAIDPCCSPARTSSRTASASCATASPISEAEFGALVARVWEAAEALPDELQPTGFEVLTAAGILVAHEADAEVLVCEVGLGGRLDSTNVLDLGVAAVTNVALDHQDLLGDDDPRDRA